MNMPLVAIRAEQSGDEPGIRRVHESTFPSDLESRLVDDLRRTGRLTVSLVAVCDDEIVGHIAFSPATLQGRVLGQGLGPIAVTAAYQRRGIGSQLVQAGIDACRKHGAGCVVVLGDRAFYRRFDFVPAVRWQLTDEYGGGDVFQALELMAGAIPTPGGLVQYAPEFAVFGPAD